MSRPSIFLDIGEVAMKVSSLVVFLALAFPFTAFSQRKEYVQLQRDIAILQDQVRALQNSLDEKTAQLVLQIQQAVDGINKANTSAVRLENDIRERFREQEQAVNRPVATVGTKVDQLTSELQAIRESLAALNVRFGRLEQQMVDTSNAIKTLQAPPPPPGGEASLGASALPGGSAEALYTNALRDKNGGNFDLAVKEFEEYLEAYGNTELAPNAQFYIGELHYLRDRLPESVKAFDLVLEKYPENNKTADAHYMKGMALFKMGQRTKGRDEFYSLISRFPDSPLAAKAQDVLKGYGYAPRPPSGKKK